MENCPGVPYSSIAIRGLLLHYHPTNAVVTVEFDRPTPLQIDGETVPDVTGYRAVSAAVPAAV